MALTKGIVSGGNYTFSAANKTITFSSDYIGMSLSDVTYITNIKSGVATVIYDPFDATKGGVLSGLVLTLAYNTTTMGDTDPLQIIVGFTPNNATPINVNVLPTVESQDNAVNISSIAEEVDLLTQALDEGSGINLNVSDRTIKKDATGAIIPSDGVTYSFIVNKLNDDIVIDTTGYQTISFQIQATTTWSGSFTLSGRNGPVSYGIVPCTLLGSNVVLTSAFSPSLGGQSAYEAPCIYKFIRLVCTTYGSGQASVFITLKAGSQYPLGNMSQLPVNASVTALGSLGIGNLLNSVGVGSIGSSIAITGTSSPTTNVPNTTSTLASVIPFPIGIGGRELPYMGAIGGIFRYITVDGGGRYILGGDTPDTETRTQSKRGDGAIPGIPPRGVGARSNTMMGGQALNVQDVSQSEGDTTTTLLQQILVELKMLNQQLNELPLTMNLGLKMQNEVSDYRQEEYNNHVNNQ